MRKKIPKEQKGDEKLKDRGKYGGTCLLNFHDCLCGHQDISHNNKTDECRFCEYKLFNKCKVFRQSNFLLIITFDSEVEDEIDRRSYSQTIPAFHDFS